MVLIIGAGISGLSAAHKLESDYIILEKENYIGGLSTQYTPAGATGYRFDFGGHYFHFKDKLEIKKYIETFARFREFKRKSSVFILDRYIPFPIQHHLFYLPARIRNVILTEITRDAPPAADLREFLENNFGQTLFSLFFKPFLSKYYQTGLNELAAAMDKGSIPIPDRKSIAAGARGRTFSETGYNPVFYYPVNSLASFIESYGANINKGRHIRLNEEVMEIDIDKKKVRTKDNRYDYERLVNTMPLKHLLKTIKQKDRFLSPRKLRHISTLVVNIVLERKRKRLHWVYLPEEQFPFYRAGFYPAQHIPVVYLEKTVTAPHALNKDSLFAEICFTLKKLGFIEHKKEILFFDIRFIPVSYILFDKNWQTAVPPTLNKLKEYGIYSTGRYGAWDYTSMSDDIKSATTAIKEIRSTMKPM